MALEVIDQHIAISRPAFRIAKGIEFKRDVIPKAKAFKDMCAIPDHFDVACDLFDAKKFGTDLVELALAAFLRTFIPEHRPIIADLDRGHLLHAIGNIGTRNTCGSFGAQRNLFATAIFERIHFLCHDIGCIAKGSGKDFGKFEDRRGHPVVAIQLADFACSIRDIILQTVLFRQKVVRATDGLKRCHFGSPI